MQTVATTRMSSKGQVVIPEIIRERLGIEAGAQFIVIGDDDVVILKTLQRPAMSEFDNLIRKARQQARASGLKRSDVAKALARVRSRK